MHTVLKSFVDNNRSFFKPFVAFLRDLYYFRSALIVIITPLLLLPLIVVVDTKEAKCLYVILIMAIYWITESLPLSVTALIPLFLFPLFGVLTAKKTAAEYVQDATFLFMAGFLVAIAIERAQVHRRLALKAILIVGSDPKWILLAIMSTTGFLSMWMSNTATTAMMLPIVEAILIELVKDKRLRMPNIINSSGSRNYSLNETIINDPQSNNIQEQTNPLDRDTMSNEELNLCKMMLLSICYSSNIGGIATLTGTPTNIIAIGMIERIYGPNTGITYATWMGFALPLSVLNLGFVWILLLLFFYGFRKTFSRLEGENKSKVTEVVRSHYKNLGPVNFHQILTSLLFTILVLLWIFRDPKFIRGWGDYFPVGYVSDTTAAMLIAFLLFVLPSSCPDFLCLKKRDKSNPPKLQTALLDWPTVQKNFPWGLILLIGGGFALASAVEQSGLSKVVGDALFALNYLSAGGVCAITAIIATFATEVTTNMGVISILAPILSSVAEKMSVNPLYFELTATVCVSYAFMLPIATPPNAIVFGYGYLRVFDMIKIGFFINLLAIALTLLAVNTWGSVIFDLGTFPSWALQTNDTMAQNNFSSILTIVNETINT